MTDTDSNKRKYRFVSLRMRFLIMFVVALFVGVLLFVVADGATTSLIKNVYLSEENKNAREARYYEDLQDYIEEENITYAQIDQLSEWSKNKQYLYLMIYNEYGDENYYIPDGSKQPLACNHTDETGDGKCDLCGAEYTPPCEHIDEDGDEVCDKCGEEYTPSCEHIDEDGDNICDKCDEKIETSQGKDDKDEELVPGITIRPTKSEIIERAKERDMLLITFPNDTETDEDAGEVEPEGRYVYVRFAEFTEYLYYDVANLACFALAAIVVLSIFLVYITTMSNRISTLGAVVTTVANGDTDKKIESRGHDEISELAMNVETMRSSIVENYKKEKEARDSNTALITSMSHDLRTPLTILLGYIDVMRTHSENDEKMQQYLKAAETTALRLKNLSDDMLGYFLVFGNDDMKVELEKYDARTLIEQMMSEHILLMRESGYSVVYDINGVEFIGGKSVETDVQCLIRIVDNMFSNINKYADKSQDVKISVNVDACNLKLGFCNYIRTDDEQVESNGIGLKSCEKLAQYIGAKFEHYAENNLFYANLYLRIF